MDELREEIGVQIGLFVYRSKNEISISISIYTHTHTQTVCSKKTWTTLVVNIVMFVG